MTEKKKGEALVRGKMIDAFHSFIFSLGLVLFTNLILKPVYPIFKIIHE